MIFIFLTTKESSKVTLANALRRSSFIKCILISVIFINSPSNSGLQIPYNLRLLMLLESSRLWLCHQSGQKRLHLHRNRKQSVGRSRMSGRSLRCYRMWKRNSLHGKREQTYRLLLQSWLWCNNRSLQRKQELLWLRTGIFQEQRQLHKRM